MPLKRKYSFLNGLIDPWSVVYERQVTCNVLREFSKRHK